MSKAPALMRKVLEQARQLQHKGRFAESEAAYASLLRRNAASVEALHGLALLYAQCGRLEEARQRVDQALGLDPRVPALHFHRAEIVAALGQRQQALDSYREALRLRPEYFEVLVNLADLLLQSERPEEALGHLDAAVRQRPDDVAALNNRGNALQALKRHEEALRCYDRVLTLLPAHPDVLNNRASALLSLARFGEAESACRQALAQKPDHPRALLNLGRAQGAQGLLEEALRQFDAALALAPGEFDAWCERAALLRELQRLREARESLEQALALRPESAHAWADLGATLLLLGQSEAALGACERALALDPGRAAAWANKGLALFVLERHEMALPAYARAIELDPRTAYAQGRLAWLNLRLGDWRDHAGLTARTLEGVRHGERVAEPLEFLFLSDNAEEQLACARVHALDKYPPAPHPLWQGERYRHERIRLAYVSGDFRDHPSWHLLADLFERHDRSRFEVFGVSIGPEAQGATAARVAAAFERFERARELSDRDLAALLHRHEIDIAVDLMGYTTYCKTGALALRPCPVLVNYLGFPATMGTSYIDYLIADDFVVPPGREVAYAEKVVRLPDTFQANDARRPGAGRTPGRTEAGLPERGVVFCSFNKSAKITPALFDAWMEILRAAESAVLWLWKDSARVEDNLRREAQTRGVAPDRLVFAPTLPYPDHLARLQQADVALDTLPFNGGATTSDALRSGVPVVTCPGEAFAARMSGSLLHAIGMPELIAPSLVEYQAVAIRLATDANLLAATKRKLAANRDTHPLFDTDRFRRHLEAAYEIMHARSQDGEPPAHFSVDPSASSATSTTR